MDEYHPKCNLTTVKHNDSFGLVSLVLIEEIDLYMNRFLYRHILRNSLVKLENSFVFQHDNDRKHIAGLVNDWLKQTLNWPRFSPDMKPIEHLWNELQRRMKKQ